MQGSGSADSSTREASTSGGSGAAAALANVRCWEMADSYNFNITYTDAAKFVRPMVLTLWPANGAVQIYDSGPKRMFLARTVPQEKVTIEQLFLGATVVICARPYHVVDFADAVTRRLLTTRGSSLVLVLPAAYSLAGQALQLLRGAGLQLGRLRMVRWSVEEAEAFLAAGAAAGAPASAPGAAAALARDHMLAIECVGKDCCARVHSAVGPADPAAAAAADPHCLRAVLGSATASAGGGGGGGGGAGGAPARDLLRTSASPAAAAAEVAYIFDRSYPYTAVCTHCAAVVVKPHAVAAGAEGAILQALLAAGLEVSALRSCALSRSDAADLFEPYKGVAAEYERWATELSSGVSVCMEVRGEGAVGVVRELAGPVDVAVARVLAPHSLRARFGVDNVKNALHVTDVDVDGPLECRFLFSVAV